MSADRLRRWRLGVDGLPCTIEGGPASLHDGPVARVGVAAVDLARTPRRVDGVGTRRPYADERLKGDSRERHQQLHEVRAALHATQFGLYELRPSWLDPFTNNGTQRRGGLAADGKRTGFGASGDILHDELLIYHEAHPHVVEVRSRCRHELVIAPAYRVGFRVHHVCLDVVQAIITSVTAKVYTAGVQELATSCGMEWHERRYRRVEEIRRSRGAMY